jgi:iron(III) transport system ATP-binding protein
MSSVTLSDVALTYPDGTVGLEGIDLQIADGEFIALVGPSGSGKTTLLRTIAGFLAPTTGTVHLGDALVAGGGTLVEPEKRGLGMVFQQHAIWPHWNVAKNVGYPLARVEEVLETVGLAGYGQRNPATLSGGQRQRVALARAIVGRPRVLLLDEALSALDEPLRDSLRLQLQNLTRSIGLTVIHVTHDRSEALALADRVVVLDEGRILQVASPPELVRRPASPAVARFLSDATLFDGRVDSTAFTATGHPASIPLTLLDSSSATGEGIIAVLPEDVELVPDADGDAEVVSSLFGRAGNDVVADWQGIRVRSRTSGRRLLVGERVTVTVRRALFYPGSRVLSSQ